MRILLVEDNADHRELMRLALTGHDLTWQVEGVVSGEEALRHLAEGEAYDLVFLDYSMPGRDGLEVLEEIRGGEAPPPVVMVTGRGDEQVAVEAMKGGAYDYVVKGEDYLQLLWVVAQRAVEAHQLAVERKGAEEALRRSEGEARRLAQESAIMAEIGRIISSTLNIEEVYDRFTEQVRKVVPFDRVVINIVDFEKNTVTVLYVTGISVPGRQPGDIFPLAGSLTEEAIRTRKGLIFHPQDENEIADRFPGFFPVFRAGFRSIMVVPLISKDQAIGGLHFESTKPNIYTNVDLKLAQSIGSQIAGAIANAQLFRERMRAEKDLRSSREQLRALAVRLQSAREEERTQVAREIHDDLGQKLTALKIDLFWLKKRLPKDQKLQLEKIKSMSKLIDMTVKTVKRISTELRPGLLDDLGLAAAIEWQAQDFQNRTGIKCEFNSSLRDIELDRDRSTAVFRIFQETLTNVARHSKATRVEIGLKEDAGRIILIVQDNGRGITKSEIFNAKSLGLVGMSERALLFGGELKISSMPGKGTTVTVTIPLVEKQ